MKVYAMFFLITIIFGLSWHYKTKLIDNIMLFLLVGYLFIITGWRNYAVGTDTINYVSLFNYFGSSVNDINFFDLVGMVHARFEYGYILLNKIVFYFTNNPRWLLIIFAFISYYVLFLFIKKLSIDPYLSVTMFVCLGYMAMTMNTMRQGIAVAFVMLAYISLLKYHSSLLCIVFVFCAFLFHKTALFFLVVLIFKNWQYTKINVVRIMIISLVIAAIYGKFENVINQINYTDYANSNITSGYLGIILNIMLLIYFLVVGYIANKHGSSGLLTKYYSQINQNILPILIITSIGVYVISFNFSQLTRIASYFELAAIIYVPNSLKEIKDNKLYTFLKLLTYIILLIYFFVILLLRPHWTNITPYIFG
ncbi:EpsG family protein [Weissella cibaria]|uniref:EpsG family protein n=1 Tax=Weissella cibaria TaxID=137591 RepID=UPI00223AF82F|nr:EpsG family protein [Weissella cibaria]MCT0020853.1 EpsG family protein [Weissella cibaria]